MGYVKSVWAYYVVNGCGSDCVHQVDGELEDKHNNEEGRHLSRFCSICPVALVDVDVALPEGWTRGFEARG